MDFKSFMLNEKRQYLKATCFIITSMEYPQNDKFVEMENKFLMSRDTEGRGRWCKTGKSYMREIFVVMGYFCILMSVITEIHRWHKMGQNIPVYQCEFYGHDIIQ
jgi:hypothetical protein